MNIASYFDYDQIVAGCADEQKCITTTAARVLEAAMCMRWLLL
jgi:hypothetical protein